MSHVDLIRRADAVAVLVKAQIASCTCMTKTPDPDWHDHGCRYRILREAEAMIHHVEAVPIQPAAALEAAFAAGVEAAAKVADEYSRRDHIAADMAAGIFPQQSDVPAYIAAAIRALAPVKGDTE